MFLLLLACSGSTPEQSNLAEYARCKVNAECAQGLQCLDARLQAVGEESWESGACRRDAAQHRAAVDALHLLLEQAIQAAEQPPADLPSSCGGLSAEGNHYIVESHWAKAARTSGEFAPHYIENGVPSELNGRLGPSAGMSDSDLVGSGRQVQWILAKRYLAVTVEQDLLFPVVDLEQVTYVPGYVNATVYLYDQQDKRLVCGGAQFSGKADKATTPSPAGDLQSSSLESLKAALKTMVPGLRFYV